MCPPGSRLAFGDLQRQIGDLSSGARLAKDSREKKLPFVDRLRSTKHTSSEDGIQLIVLVVNQREMATFLRYSLHVCGHVCGMNESRP